MVAAAGWHQVLVKAGVLSVTVMCHDGCGFCRPVKQHWPSVLQNASSKQLKVLAAHSDMLYTVRSEFRPDILGLAPGSTTCTLTSMLEAQGTLLWNGRILQAQIALIQATNSNAPN